MQSPEAYNMFYGAVKERSNMLLVVKKVHDRSFSSGEILYSCWFAKILCFVRIATSAEDYSRCRDCKEYHCQICHHQLYNELYFVQWYEIQIGLLLPMDMIDGLLNCIRLRWQRVPGESNVMLTRKEFGLVPLESIRSAVTVVPKDKFLSFVDNDY